MEAKSHGEVVSAFWALFLGSEVAKDGQVKGYQTWCRAASEFAEQEAHRCAEWCWIKIERDGRDPDECIAAGVRYARDSIRRYQAPAEETPDPEYSAFRMSLIHRIMEEKLKPIEVARILESAADRFPLITLQECTLLRAMGDWWTPEEKPPTWWDRHVLQERKEKQMLREDRWKWMKHFFPDETEMPTPLSDAATAPQSPNHPTPSHDATEVP